MGHNGIIAASRRSICHVVTAYYSTTGQTSALNACAAGVTVLRYHNGTGTYPVNGDTIYTSSNGCTIFDGGSLYYADDGLKSYIINSAGKVSSASLC